MTTTKRTETAQLYWSERGQVGCALPGHAPYPGTDTWRHERWRPITPAEARGFEREAGRPPACETCAAIARNSGDRS